MAKREEKRLHPETGKELVRGTRSMTLKFKSQTETFDMPGWYAEDDVTGDYGLHDEKDMRASDKAITAMKAREAALPAPEEIKMMRKRLKLSQRDAGFIIGGGPNAFQKYEAGLVLISKGVANALHLLLKYPGEIEELRTRYTANQADDKEARKMGLF